MPKRHRSKQAGWPSSLQQRMLSSGTFWSCRSPDLSDQPPFLLLRSLRQLPGGSLSKMLMATAGALRQPGKPVRHGARTEALARQRPPTAGQSWAAAGRLYL